MVLRILPADRALITALTASSTMIGIPIREMNQKENPTGPKPRSYVQTGVARVNKLTIRA